PVLALKRTNTFYLPSKLGFEVRRQVDEPPLVVLGGACIQPQCARLEVELTALQHEDLALHPPAKRVGDSCGDLKVWRQVLSDGLILLALEEALARRSFLRLSSIGGRSSFLFLNARRSIFVTVPSSRRIVESTAPSLRLAVMYLLTSGWPMLAAR